MFRNRRLGAVLLVGTLVCTAAAASGVAAHAVPRAHAAGVKQFSLTPASALTGGASYGYVSAASGATVVSGALSQTVAGHTRAGAAYVFQRPAHGWRSLHSVATLTSPHPQNDGQFGVAVAISGRTIAVGANDENSDTGAVYVFTEPKHGWKSTSHPTATLHLATPANGDLFGANLAMSGNTIVADAADRAVGAQPSAGALFVFTKPKAGWRNAAPTAELTSSDEVTGDGFGIYLGISGDVIVGGDYSHNSGAGEAALFVKPKSGWTSDTETRMLTGTALTAGDEFGTGISVSPTTIAVGAPDHSASATSHGGAVFVYQKPAGGWGSSPSALAPTAELSETSGQADAFFGASTSIAGGLLVIGAPYDTVGSATRQGAVYPVFRPAGGWHTTTLSTRLVASGGQAQDQLGTSVWFSGNELIAGADGRDGDRGATYLWAQRGPKLTKAKQSHNSWHLGSGGPKTNPKSVPGGKGSLFSVGVDQPAQVTMAFSEKRHGHFRHVGTLRFTAHAGSNTEYVAGKLGHHKKLKPGHCKVSISAENLNGRTSSKTLSFTTHHAK
jgi:FG-GAP repeat